MPAEILYFASEVFNSTIETPSGFWKALAQEAAFLPTDSSCGLFCVRFFLQRKPQFSAQWQQ